MAPRCDAMRDQHELCSAKYKAQVSMEQRLFAVPVRTPRKPTENDHEYLRQHVDPILMPLIEALLLYQPESIYEFIHDYVDDSKASRFHGAHAKRVSYARKVSSRRKMVDFMSTSVIPVMDDLAHQILRDKPTAVTAFIRDLVAARIVVGTTSSMNDSNQLEYVNFRVHDRVLCRYKGRPRYYPGVIQAIDADSDTFTVLYDDGKTEHNVHRLCLKPEHDGAAPPRRRSSAGDDNQVEDSSAPTVVDGDGKSTGENGGTTREMEIVILIIGIDGAGKTTLLSTLQGDLEKDHVPSAGFTSIKFQTETGSATFYDLGGGPAFRDVWKEYYADAHGIVFVVDSSKDAAIRESSKILADTMSHRAMARKPTLVYANKRDQPTAVAEDQLFHALSLSSLPCCRLMPCVAKPSANGNMVDDRLEMGLHWLFEQVHAQFDDLESRVREDVIAKKREDDERRAAQRARVAAWKEERESAEMVRHDKHEWQPSTLSASAAPSAAPAKAKTETPEQDTIMCSNCSTAPAVTKCAASKWMPVCGECATTLKNTAASGNQ
ncbi:hypothetical protein P43SY_002082 [Pythium insidiosum]|uniref:ADP-ribosylation factor-like protein n=1 Tax=Pythium insidiosum TaxID=114742 RepID=A0AAD5QC99_PYTIN|nr:hypothetical protein P43SY_002082 [Pythium insidiosum]